MSGILTLLLGKGGRTIFERPAEKEKKMETLKGIASLILLVAILYFCNITAVSIVGDFLCQPQAEEYLAARNTEVRHAPFGRLLGYESYGELNPYDSVKVTDYFPNAEAKIYPCKRDIFWRQWVRIKWNPSPTNAGWVLESNLAPIK